MNKLTHELIKDLLPINDFLPRVPRKKGQHRGSKSHSDLYTDENPKGTIKGLKFEKSKVKDPEEVSKIKSSGRSHSDKIQLILIQDGTDEQYREMGKTSEEDIWYIENTSIR